MKTLFCLLVTLFLGILHAQQIQISGTVVNKKNKPLENVNIYLEGSFDGALSDKQGYFVFSVQDSVVDGVLKLTHPQFGNLDKAIHTRQDYIAYFVLNEADDFLGEIVIQANRRNKQEQADRIAFSTMDVVSTAGSPGNIIGLLSTMPGAQTNGEDGRLLIRGGKADESGIYVNGIRVFQPYTASAGNMPVRSKFNPFLFKGMSFSAGGYSAEFGDALSGVLQLDTSDDTDPSRKDMTISAVGVSVGQTHQWKKHALSYSLNYLNLGAYTAVIKQRYKTKKPFSILSGEVVYKREIKEGGYKFYAAVDYTTMAYEQEVKPQYRVDTLALKANNVYVNSLYFKKMSPFMRLDIGTGLGFSDYKGDVNEKFIERENWDFNQKVKLSYQWNGRWQSFAGVEVQLSKLNLNRGINQHEEKVTTQAINTALFFENQWFISPLLTLRTGVRSNKNIEIDKWVVEPRALLSFQVDTKQQVSFSYGIFNQALNLEQGLYVKQEDWMQANHYIFNYTYAFKKRMLRAEAFYKEYKKLLMTSGNDTEGYTQLGKGYAKGVDLFWKDNTSLKNFMYWITYTYLDSKRKEMYRDDWIQPAYVVKHNVSVVTKYWIEAWKSQVSMTYNYMTPRVFYNTDVADNKSYKSSSIHKVSLSWSYLLSAQKILYASVDNLLGQDPIQAYQFNQQLGQPDWIQSSAKRFVYIGFMWTISADKKTNQLENL